MATIVELDGVAPTIGEDVFLAPTAVLVGDVRVGDRCNIWFGTVLRGDVSHIEIGAGCSIQDTAVIHCADDLPTVIGADVVVGHGAMLEGCTIGDGALIGMGAVVLQHAQVGDGRDGRRRRGRVRAHRDPRRGPRGGRPALRSRRSCPARRWLGPSRAAQHYQQLREHYLKTSRVRHARRRARPLKLTQEATCPRC